MPSTNSTSWALDRAPTLVASTVPFLNTRSVGMPRTLNLAAVSGLLSTSTLQILTRPAYSIGKFVEQWGNHFAGTTPGRPKIYQCRDV